MSKRIACTLFCLCSMMSVASASNRVVDNSLEAIQNRLSPVGKGVVTTDTAAAPVVAAQNTDVPVGESVYKSACAVCHAAGVAGAPKYGDSGAWKPRIAKGMDTLLKHVIEGYNAMPARGTCMTCSDDDLKAAIEYMIK